MWLQCLKLFDDAVGYKKKPFCRKLSKKKKKKSQLNRIEAKIKTKV